MATFDTQTDKYWRELEFQTLLRLTEVYYQEIIDYAGPETFAKEAK